MQDDMEEYGQLTGIVDEHIQPIHLAFKNLFGFLYTLVAIDIQHDAFDMTLGLRYLSATSGGISTRSYSPLYLGSTLRTA